MKGIESLDNINYTTAQHHQLRSLLLQKAYARRYLLLKKRLVKPESVRDNCIETCLLPVKINTQRC